MLDPGVTAPLTGSARSEPAPVRALRVDHEPPAAREVTLFDVLKLFVRQRYLILAVIAICVVLTVTLTLTKPRTFSSDVSFVTQQTDGAMGGLSAVAAQFGLRVPSGSPSRSPEFYADLIRGDEIARRLALDTVEATRDGKRTKMLVAALLVPTALPSAERVERAVRALHQTISVATRRESGIVSVSVRTKWPDVSHALGVALVTLLDQFNVETNQAQAAAERRFSGARLDEASAELRVAEDELRQFLTRNRQFESSPDLAFEHQRLQRRVSMRQQLMTALAEAYARARMEESRTTSPLTVIAAPRVPVMPDPRGLINRTAIALIVGLMFGIVLAVVREVAWAQWLQFRSAAGGPAPASLGAAPVAAKVGNHSESEETA